MLLDPLFGTYRQRALSPAPELAMVFGSLARGDENAGSDIDLLMIADCRTSILSPSPFTR